MAAHRTPRVVPLELGVVAVLGLTERRAEDAPVAECRGGHRTRDRQVLGIALRVDVAVVEYERPDHRKEPSLPGRIVHFELVATDADRAAGFWNGLFDWNVGTSVMEGFDYRMFDLGEGQGGAIYRLRRASRPARRSSTSTPRTSRRRSPRCASSAGAPTTSSRCRRTAGSPAARTPRGTRSTSGRATRTRLERFCCCARRSGRPRGVGAGRGDGEVRRARRRVRGARLLHRDPARLSAAVVLAVRAGGIGGLRHVAQTPAVDVDRRPDGLHRRLVDHVRPAADRRDGGDRDLDRGSARDGRGDRPVRLFGVDQIAISPTARSGSRCWESARPSRSFDNRVSARSGLGRPDHGLRDLGLDLPRHHYAGRTIPPLFAASTRFIASGTIMALVVTARGDTN